MKKILLLSASVLAIAACTEKIDEGSFSAIERQQVVFEGGFNGGEGTKVAFGESSNGVYALTWSAGDAIGIFSYDQTTTTNLNVRADLLKRTAGQPLGTFIPVDEVIEGIEGEPDTTISLQYPTEGSERFLVYYPYNSKTDISVEGSEAGKIHSAISEIQIQDAVADKKVGSNGFSYAMVDVTAEAKKVNFKLNHTMAYLRFVVSTSDYAAYQLHAVQLYDSKGTASFGGEFVVDPRNGELNPVAGKTISSVKVVVDNHDFTATPEKEVYLTILPGDYSAADCKVVITFIKEDGTTASIPTTIKNLGNVPAGSLTTVNVSANKSDNKCAWYEPEESRDMLNMWAYGPQNTYYVEQKYTGQGETSLTIDVKARGDFSKVKEPKYYGWLAAADMRGLCKFTDGSTAYETIPTHQIGSDYKVTVVCVENPTTETTNWFKAKGHLSVLAIYDEDYNIIWSFNIFKYLTDDPIQDVSYPSTDIVMMDRVLGTYSPKFAIEKCGGNPDIGVAYFQWGRKDPFFWSNSGLSHYTQAYVSESSDIAYAIAHPTTILASTKGDGWDAKGKWYVGDNRADLWGAEKHSKDLDKNLVGHKTIYDPCPQGYRVMDDKVALAVNANASMWEISNGLATQVKDRIKTDTPFLGQASVLAYPLGNDNYDYWYYAGAHWGSNNNWGNRVSSNSKHGFCYYTNSCSQEDTRVGVLQGVYFSSGWGTATDNKLCDAYPIRCQKDEYGK